VAFAIPLRKKHGKTSVKKKHRNMNDKEVRFNFKRWGLGLIPSAAILQSGSSD
jgi:hypothetical protein